MKYDELIKHCIQIISTFNPIVETADSHSSRYFAENGRHFFDTEK